MVEPLVMITADVIELHKMVYALRAENERLQKQLDDLRTTMCGMEDALDVRAALAPPAPEEEGQR